MAMLLALVSGLITCQQPIEPCLKESEASIFAQGDPEYSTFQIPFNTRFANRYPVFIIQPQSTEQTQKVIQCVHTFGMPFRVRGGGHSYGGFSAAMNGSALIDLQKMNKLISVDSSGVFEVEAGARLGPLYDDLWLNHSLMVSGGTCRHVGVGGHGQGGGFGYISRTYGLFSDQIKEFLVVLYNGTLVTANATENNDLYWALRGGGGGNFGIVTSYKMQAIQNMPNVVRFNATVPYIGSIAEFLVEVQEYIPNQDKRFNIAISIGVGFVLRFDGHWIGDLDDLKTLLQQGPLKKFAFKFYPGAYHDVMNDDGPNQSPHSFVATSNWIYDDSLRTKEQFHTLLDAADTHLRPFWGIQFHAYGSPSAVNQISPNSTAFPFRRTLWSIQIAANFKKDEDAQMEGFEKFHSIISQQVFDVGAYRCYPDVFLSNTSYMNAYYLNNSERLRIVKSKYDPINMFQFEQSIQ
eukprot:m.72621 g.72621  ORF g.72621 m.72621 type:complete len:464 (+) comp12338_c0_seq5:116-1507(+)